MTIEIMKNDEESLAVVFIKKGVPTTTKYFGSNELLLRVIK